METLQKDDSSNHSPVYTPAAVAAHVKENWYFWQTCISYLQ